MAVSCWKLHKIVSCNSGIVQLHLKVEANEQNGFKLQHLTTISSTLFLKKTAIVFII